MDLNIFEIEQKVTNAEYELRIAEEKRLNKEISLWLDTDWDNLKKEKGITTEGKRKAHVQRCTTTLRQEVTRLKMDHEHWVRVLKVTKLLLLVNKPDMIDVVVGV
jgi:hypothetical protein